MNSPEVTRRDFCLIANEALKAIVPLYGLVSDAIVSAKLGEPHVSPGTALGVLLRLRGSTMPEGQLDITPAFPAGEAAPYRAARRIEPFLTDYLPDDKSLKYTDRVAYYRLLKDRLGISSIRTEFHMKDMVDSNGNVSSETVNRYRESLLAMKEAGLAAPTLVLFTPSEEMYEAAKKNSTRFVELYEICATQTADLCKETGVAPARVQAMNEVNTKFQTKVGKDTTITLIQKTADIFRKDFPQTKIITTVATEPFKGWKDFSKELIQRCGDSLDGVGFDYYPGTYEHTIGVPIIGEKPYEAFAGITPYPWLAEQKLDGVLKDKEVIITEIGAPAIEPDDLPETLKRLRPIVAKLGYDQRFQRFGYDRIVQALDHFFLGLERKGTPAHKFISAIGFFQGGEIQGVDTKAPGGLDFFPWTLMRKNSVGQWQLTKAGEHLKHLITTRINPSI